jgi:hypothetical protein
MNTHGGADTHVFKTGQVELAAKLVEKAVWDHQDETLTDMRQRVHAGRNPNEDRRRDHLPVHAEHPFAADNRRGLEFLSAALTPISGH